MAVNFEFTYVEPTEPKPDDEWFFFGLADGAKPACLAVECPACGASPGEQCRKLKSDLLDEFAPIEGLGTMVHLGRMDKGRKT